MIYIYPKTQINSLIPPRKVIVGTNSDVDNQVASMPTLNHNDKGEYLKIIENELILYLAPIMYQSSVGKIETFYARKSRYR